MNKNLLVAATLGALVAVAGCGGGTVANDSPDSGSIVVQGYSGIFQDNFQKAVIDPFQEKFPNIKVEYRGVATSADNLASLRSEKSSPTIDVSIMDLSVSATANKTDLLQPLDPAKVPNMKDIDERGQVEGNFGPAITFDSLVLIYNDKVNPAPTSR